MLQRVAHVLELTGSDVLDLRFSLLVIAFVFCIFTYVQWRRNYEVSHENAKGSDMFHLNSGRQKLFSVSSMVASLWERHILPNGHLGSMFFPRNTRPIPKNVYSPSNNHFSKIWDPISSSIFLAL